MLNGKIVLIGRRHSYIVSSRRNSQSPNGSILLAPRLYDARIGHYSEAYGCLSRKHESGGSGCGIICRRLAFMKYILEPISHNTLNNKLNIALVSFAGICLCRWMNNRKNPPTREKLVCAPSGEQKDSPSRVLGSTHDRSRIRHFRPETRCTSVY